MIASLRIEGLALRRLGACRFRDNGHAIGGLNAAGPHQPSVHLHHAGVAGLDGSQLVVIADLGDLDTAAIDEINEPLFRLDGTLHPVDGYGHRRFSF